MRITNEMFDNETNQSSFSTSFRMEKIEPIPLSDEQNGFRISTNAAPTTPICYESPTLIQSSSSLSYPTMRSANTITTRACNDTNRYKDVDSYYIDNVLRGRQAQKLGQDMDAIAYYQRAILAKNHTILSESIIAQKDYANILFHMGSIYLQQYTTTNPANDSTNNNDKSCLYNAAVVFEKCLELRNICYPAINEVDGSFIPQHIEVCVTMYYLAHVQIKIGTDYPYALSLLNEALSILLIGYPNHMNCIITIWQELSHAQYAMGDLDDAESSLNEIRLLKKRMSRSYP